MPSTTALAFSGVVGACLTPFSSDGTVDEVAMRTQIEFMVGDSDAISIAAVEAAEYRLLSPAERRELIRMAADAVGGRRPIIIGASAPTIGEVLELAELAADVEAAAVQVLIPQRPWGAEPEGPELLAWFEEVAGACPLPIVAYHHPHTGADPPLDVLASLSRVAGVAGFKDSSRDITRIGWLVDNIDRPGHVRYFTTMQPLLTTLLLGGSGAMMPPPATRIAGRIVAAFRTGDLASAAEEQRAFASFPGTWSRYGLTPLMKRAMIHCGIEMGAAAAPSPQIPVALEEAIVSFVQQHIRPDTPGAG